MQPPRFLVLRGGAIGDFIVTLPALRALRTRRPDAHIELIGYPHIANLALASGLADVVRALDTARIAPFFGLRTEIGDDMRTYLLSFRVVLSYLHDPDGVVGANLRRFGARELLYRSPVDPRGHIVDHLLKPLETLALYEAGAAPELPLNEAALRAGRAWLDASGAGDAPLAIHAGSGSPRKNWPLDRFQDVASRLAGRGVPLLFVLGEADKPIAERVRETARATAAAIAEHLDLVALAGVLAHCRGYLGNDSGITHIAAALGLPTVAVFGPTDPAQWAPRGSRVRVLRADDRRLESIDADRVMDALTSFGGRRMKDGRDPSRDCAKRFPPLLLAAGGFPGSPEVVDAG